MESKLHTLSAFQIYSIGIPNDVNIMIDQLWIEDNRLFFRVVEGIPPNIKAFRNEPLNNAYSISRKDFISIRCRLYF